VVAAVLGLALAACSATSPAIVLEPYTAADGTNAAIKDTTVELRNFLVVGSAKGKPAEVIGAVVNTGQEAVEVTLQSDPGATGPVPKAVVKVPPLGLTQVGPDQEVRMTLEDLAAEPGALMSLSASTAAGGSTDFSVPVFPPTSYYSGLTPPPSTPSASPTAS
jgi:hypothetical protein